MQEKRRTTRLSIDIPVKIRFNGITMPGKTRNLSCGGIFIHTPKASPPTGKCELILTLPDGKAPMVVSSQVVWNEEKKPKRSVRKKSPPVYREEVEAPAAPEPAPARQGTKEEDDGTGLQFKNLEPEQKERINAFIERTMRENLH